MLSYSAALDCKLCYSSYLLLTPPLLSSLLPPLILISFSTDIVTAIYCFFKYPSSFILFPSNESYQFPLTSPYALALYRSLSVEHTASDIYKGLKQGRDVVVPGLVNKLYTYLFSQILPSAAVGAITQVCYTRAQHTTLHYTTLHYTTLHTCLLA